MPAQPVSLELTESKRGSKRRKLRLGVQGVVSGSDNAQVLLHDLSETGLLLEASAQLAEGDVLSVELPQVGVVSAAVVWVSGRLFGCKFQAPISRGAVSAALLRSPGELASAVAADRTAPLGLEDDARRERLHNLRTLRTKVWSVIALALGAWALVGAAAALIFM